jgi:hypothetical protein
MNEYARFRPMRDITECELIFGTDPAEIARVLGFNEVDHAVGFLSRCGFTDMATDLYNTAHKEEADA